VSGAGSMVPSDGVAGHVSPKTPSFDPCLLVVWSPPMALQDPSDLAIVVGCSVGVVIMVQMVSQPSMLLLPSMGFEKRISRRNVGQEVE
jgi:hypothetical protein